MKDKMTFEELYTKYSPMVYRRCYSMLKDEQLAADCMHDTFLKVHSRWKTLIMEFPSSLLYTMATNHVLNVIRDSKASIEDDTLEAIAGAYCTLTEVSNRSLISKILGNSDEKSGTMAVMHYSDGWSVAEVAGHFKVSIPAVRKRLKKLQEISKKEFSYE